MAEQFLSTPVKTIATLKLHAGTDAGSGKDIVKSVNLTGLSLDPNADDLYAIGMALAQCLEYPAVGMEMTQTRELSFVDE